MDGIFLLFFINKSRKHYVMFSVTESTSLEDGRSGERLVDEIFVFFILSVDMVDDFWTKRKGPNMRYLSTGNM